MSSADERDVYTRLAEKLTGPEWGWLDHIPENGALQRILKEYFDDEEAQALIGFPMSPVALVPVALEEIKAKSGLPHERLEAILQRLVDRGFLFPRETASCQPGYILVSNSYGYPQIFFWRGERDARAQKMAQFQKDGKYLKSSYDMYTSIETKPFRYVPSTEAIDPQWQNVYPTDTIEKIIQKARKIALAHCGCRLTVEMVKGEGCGHSLDVCMKLNDLAECVIQAGLAREISHEEALAVIKKARDEGLVHFSDNTAENINHICNCCGDACWTIVPIRRRRIPRDVMMATYFLRETDEDECIGCENCVEICPVDAVTMEDGVAKVDLEWCIGCGVCVTRCSGGAIKLVEKEQKPAQTRDFADLHQRISAERAAVVMSRRSTQPSANDTEARG